MIDKHTLANEIGNFFGSYFEQDGKFCINNYDSIYRCGSVDALLIDWVDTLVENQYDNPELSGYWESEIEFIYSQVIGKYPVGIRPVENKTKDRTWKASIDVKDPHNPHGKSLHLGTYASIVDAIVARFDITAEHLQSDKHLFTCFADKGYSFLVHGLDAQDAETAGMEWYKKTFSEPGHFSCWRTDENDLPRLDFSEVIESTKYRDMLFNSVKKVAFLADFYRREQIPSGCFSVHHRKRTPTLIFPKEALHEW